MNRPADRRARSARNARTLVAAIVAACLAFGAATPGAPASVTGSEPAETLAARTGFVAFGDSLTSGYGNPGKPWPVVLASMRADLRLVRNSGVAGNTTRDMLRRIDSDVFAYSPDLLFIFAGINDLSACESIDEIVGNVKAMVAGAQAHGIRRVVLILNSHSVVLPEGPACVPTVQATMNRLDDAMAAYGVAAGIQTIDLRPVLDTEGGFTPAFFVADGIHYNENGAARVAAAISEQVAAEQSAPRRR